MTNLEKKPKYIPTIDSAIYTFGIPSQNMKEYRFRPFRMRENQALLAAESTEDEVTMVETLKQVISSCCLDDLDVENLACWDIEYLLLKLRSVSIVNTVDYYFYCEDEEAHKADPDSARQLIRLYLDNVEVVNGDKYTNEIQLADDYVLVMKTPTLQLIEDMDAVRESDQFNAIINVVAHTIDKLITKHEVIDFSEFSIQEVVDWLMDLSGDMYQKILDFYADLPYCRIKVEWTCPVCGKKLHPLQPGAVCHGVMAQCRGRRQDGSRCGWAGEIVVTPGDWNIKRPTLPA